MKHGGYPWNKGRPAFNIKDFSVNLNPLGTPKFVEELIEEAIRLKIYKYYPPQDFKDLKYTIAEIYKVNDELIGVFNGASEAINLLGNYFTVPQPNYSEYKFKDVYYAKESEDEFIFYLKPGKILTSNPNNPSGALITLSEIENFLQNKDNELVLDESFIDISLGESSLKLIEDYKNLTIINSFTKSLAIPGLRIGFTIGYRSIELERLAVPWRLNSIVYYVISNLDPKEVRYFFKLSQNKIKEIYDKVKSITTSFKIYKTYAPYFLVKFKIPTKIINDELIKRGYYIRDCSNFLGLDETYGRIALREDVDNLIYTINEIIEEKTH